MPQNYSCYMHVIKQFTQDLVLATKHRGSIKCYQAYIFGLLSATILQMPPKYTCMQSLVSAVKGCMHEFSISNSQYSENIPQNYNITNEQIVNNTIQ